MKSLGYVHTPRADHHRWSRHSRRSISTGKGEFNRTARLMLHQMRWRKPPRQFGLSIVSWVLSILVHLLVVVALLLVRPDVPQTLTPKGEPDAIQVRFIEAHPPPPPPPPAPQPPKRKAPRRTVARHVATPPSRAPDLAPVPMAPRNRPKIKLDTAMAKPDLDETPQPALQAVQPVKQPRKAPAVPPAPAPPAPPPPRVVMEKSKMALPPPKITLEQQALAQIPSHQDQPIPVARPKPVQGAPRLKMQVDQAPPVSLQPVQAPQQVMPAPKIDVGSSRPMQQVEVAPQEKLKLSETPETQNVQAPRDVPLQPIPAAPEKSPRIHLEATRPQVADTAAEKPVLENLPQVQVDVPPAPSKNVARKTSPSSTQSVPKPEQSWVHPDDRFSTLPKHPGHGTAEQSRKGKGSTSGVPDYVQVQPHGNSDVMTRRYKRLDYKPTIFAKYWAPQNQSLLGHWLQQLVDATSYAKTFDLGRGVRIHCGGWLLGFGCGGDPPDAASSKSHDRRLNMAPAQPLVPGLGESSSAPQTVAPPKSSNQSIQCETARVSGAPLPPGCATDAKPYESDQFKNPEH